MAGTAPLPGPFVCVLFRLTSFHRKAPAAKGTYTAGGFTLGSEIILLLLSWYDTKMPLTTVSSKCAYCNKEFNQVIDKHIYRPVKYCSTKCRYQLKSDQSIQNKEKRFFSKVKKMNYCWPWQGLIFKRTGYGIFQFCRKNLLAHRASWEIHNGQIPNGLCILHRCDNRPCVNPGHLFLGTRQDNMDDMVKKGRSLKGERHSMAKLKEQDVKSIRQMHSNGMPGIRIAKSFKVNKRTIYSILNGKTWVT